LRESPVPLAADESVNSIDTALEFLSAPNCPQVFVIKPSVLGGLRSLLPLLRQLGQAGRRFTITSALETEVGRRAIYSFLGAESIPGTHGLATGFLFQENHFADVAELAELPPATKSEERFRQQLDWRACP
jgi:O-succinylbenzoate synthase